LTGKALEEFKEHLEHEAKEKAEHAGTLWVESSEAKKHDCDFDPNSKSPLGGCRLKDPPKDGFKPYQGAVATPQTSDDREFKKSHLVNEEKKWEEARAKAMKEVYDE
jgi:hypothetical protein